MAVIVIDASALIELLLATDAGTRVRARLSGDEDTLHAPHLALAEALESPLVTGDSRMASAHGHRAKIELIACP